MAEEIGDAETARIAGDFATRHGERAGILERKLAVIREENAYLDREYNSLREQFQAARQPGVAEVPRPDPVDGEFDALKARADREAAQQAVQAQLEMLKKKLNKN